MTYRDISTILSNISSELQAQFIKEIFDDGKLSVDFTNKLGAELGSTIIDHFRNNFLAEIIRLFDNVTEKKLFETLKDIQPLIADKIKQNLFMVEDLVLMTPETIQKVISESNVKQFIYAIKGIPDELQERLFEKLPERLSDRLKDESEQLPTPSKDKIQEAQLEVVDIITRLRDQGELISDEY